jgi:hypothetical protein
MEKTFVSYDFLNKSFRKEVSSDEAEKVARQFSEAFGQAVVEYYDATGEIVYGSLFEDGKKTSC